HMHSGDDGAAYVAGRGTGGAGQTIHVVMADYQDMNWGNGFLRLFRFSPLDDTIHMSTYSPYSEEFITTSPDQMNLPYDMISGSPFSLIGTVHDVSSGNNASITWNGLNYNTAYEWYAVVNDGTTSITSPVWSFITEMSPINHTPEDVVLSEISVVENSAVNTVVGTFSSLDPDTGDTFTYSLVSGIGDADNASFNIVENSLRTSQIFDYETQSSYSIRVRTTDLRGLFYEKQIFITVTDVYEIIIPTLSGLLPQSSLVGSSEIPLTIIGSGFRDGAEVLWNGTPKVTTWIDPTSVSIRVPAEDVNNVDSVSITARNSDSGESNPVEFDIYTFADTVPG
ncbi:hypothetical protein EG832_22325, partial [bacterium]|nr:hypothetical protein [bacterium]